MVLCEVERCRGKRIFIPEARSLPRRGEAVVLSVAYPLTWGVASVLSVGPPGHCLLRGLVVVCDDRRQGGKEAERYT